MDKSASSGTKSPALSKSSREGSPARTQQSTLNNNSQGPRRHQDRQDFSPTRPGISTYSSMPSPAALQRALSNSRPVQQTASVDSVLDSARNDTNGRPGNSSPSWPVSPRLKSPPPSTTARSSTLKKIDLEHSQPNTSVKRHATASAPDLAATMLNQESPRESSLNTIRVSGRNNGHRGLETVVEGSVPTTPAIDLRTDPMDDVKFEVPVLNGSSAPAVQALAIKQNESNDGERPSSKAESSSKTRAPSASRLPTTSNLAKRSFNSLTGTKIKNAAEPVRTMTVETETVTSMPQLLNVDRGGGGREGSGSIRNKPSTETIRPKKEKKKTRKPPSLHAGTGTSKADIFEAKVASAVDEANTSDSDETFVYESNPPESRPNRHHSRTPSATSVTSQADQFGGRTKHGIRSGSHAVSGKKSMKFTNSAYSNNLDGEGAADSNRMSTRHGGSTPRHHHIGRHSRTVHPSMFDPDSPYTQANRPSSPRTSMQNLHRSSHPTSPRISAARPLGSPRKGEAAYDPYEDAADDERMPLMGSVRINRSRRARRPHSADFSHVDYLDEQEPGFCSRNGLCLTLIFVILLVCAGVITSLVAMSRPLVDVYIKHIENVLASEQELMLDLHVSAINTNLFSISVSDLDVNLFAQSPYVGTTSQWKEEHPLLRPSLFERRQTLIVTGKGWPWPFGPEDGVDEGTDPIDDPEPGPQKMLLGRIFVFDSPLVFDPAPFRRTPSSSIGGIRLARPGNKTEVGGSQRWERVLQHPFELIVRGVIKYQLPLSSKTRSLQIGGRAKVSPSTDEGNITTSILPTPARYTLRAT